MRWLLALVIAATLYGCLYPWHFNFAYGPVSPLLVWRAEWPRAIDRFELRDIAVNLLLYLPLGAVAYLCFARWRSKLLAATAAVATGAALSLTVEIIQIYVPGRHSSLLDVVCNSAGAAAGAALVAAFRSRLKSIAAMRRGGGRQTISAILLLCCWVGYQLYPGIPVLSRTRLWRALAVLLSTQSFSPVQVWACAAEWFTVGLLIEAVAGPRAARWLPAAMVLLPLRLLVMSRGVSLQEACGAALALALWKALGGVARKRAALFLLGSSILLTGLAPFRFSEPPHGFSWIPFAGAIEADWFPAVVTMFRKAFVYGAMVWQLRSAGLAYARAGAATALVLAAIEAAQRYLPGRTPESTDPILALLLAMAFAMLERQAAARVS